MVLCNLGGCNAWGALQGAECAHQIFCPANIKIWHGSFLNNNTEHGCVLLRLGNLHRGNWIIRPMTSTIPSILATLAFGYDIHNSSYSQNVTLHMPDGSRGNGAFLAFYMRHYPTLIFRIPVLNYYRLLTFNTFFCEAAG